MESTTKKPIKPGPPNRLKEFFFIKKNEPEKLNKTMIFNQINSSPNQLKPIPIYQKDLIPETIVKRVKGPKPIKLVIPGESEKNNELFFEKQKCLNLTALKRINAALRDVKEGTGNQINEEDTRNSIEEGLAVENKTRSQIQDFETLRGNYDDDDIDQLNIVNYPFEMNFVEQLIEKLEKSNGRLANAEDKISKVQKELEETQNQLSKTSKMAKNYGLQVTKLTELVLELKTKMMQTSSDQTSENNLSNPPETNNLETFQGGNQIYLNQDKIESSQKNQEISKQQKFLFSHPLTGLSYQPKLFNYSPNKLFSEPQRNIYEGSDKKNNEPKTEQNISFGQNQQNNKHKNQVEKQQFPTSHKQISFLKPNSEKTILQDPNMIFRCVNDKLRASFGVTDPASDEELKKIERQKQGKLWMITDILLNMRKKIMQEWNNEFSIILQTEFPSIFDLRKFMIIRKLSALSENSQSQINFPKIVKKIEWVMKEPEVSNNFKEEIFRVAFKQLLELPSEIKRYERQRDSMSPTANQTEIGKKILREVEDLLIFIKSGNTKSVENLIFEMAKGFLIRANPISVHTFMKNIFFENSRAIKTIRKSGSICEALFNHFPLEKLKPETIIIREIIGTDLLRILENGKYD